MQVTNKQIRIHRENVSKAGKRTEAEWCTAAIRLNQDGDHAGCIAILSKFTTFQSTRRSASGVESRFPIEAMELSNQGSFAIRRLDFSHTYRMRHRPVSTPSVPRKNFDKPNYR